MKFLHCFIITIIFLYVCIPIHAQRSVEENNEYMRELDSLYMAHLQKGDTLHAVLNLADLANIHSSRAEYAVSYNYIWEALKLADGLENPVLSARIYNEIGWLYSYYKRTDEALMYYNKSISIHKELTVSDNRKLQYLINDYYSVTTLYRELQKDEQAKQYLDSCMMVYDQITIKKSDSFIQAELAYYYIHQQEYEKGKEILITIAPWFEKHQPSYLIILHKFLGDAYFGLHDFEKSEYLYQQALERASKSQSHANYIPVIHQQLAHLYHRIHKNDLAFNELLKAKETEATLFDSRSLHNRPLLEILDSYKEEQELQQELIQQQKLEQLEHQQHLNFYKSVAFITVIIFLFLVGFLGYRAIKLKHQNEREQRLLKIQKNTELIELKNKELALSTLKLIEKDKKLATLKQQLLGTDKPVSKREIVKAFKVFSIDYNKNWEEFEARFVAINASFYKVLNEKYPNLSTSELKLCALLKLNFSGKEIANLLGVGHESIHTYRYRLRKKFDLTREDNISKFLNSLA